MAESDAIVGFTWLQRYVTTGGLVRLPDGAQRLVQIGELCGLYVREGSIEWSHIALICRSEDGELSAIEVARAHAAHIGVSDDGNVFSPCISCGRRAALDARCRAKCSPTCTAESPGGDLPPVGQHLIDHQAELGPEVGRGEEAAGTQPLPTQRGNGPTQRVPEHRGGNTDATTAGAAEQGAQRRIERPAKKKKTTTKGEQQGRKGQGRETGVEAMPTDATVAAARASTGEAAQAASAAAAAAAVAAARRAAAAEAAEAAAAAADAAARREVDDAPEDPGLGQDPADAAERSEEGDGPEDRDSEQEADRPGNMGPPTPRARRGPDETRGARRGNARPGAEGEYGARVEGRADERARRTPPPSVGLTVMRSFLGTACAQCVHPNKESILDQLAERLQERCPVYQTAEVSFIPATMVNRCWGECAAMARCSVGRPLYFAPW